MDPVTQHAIRTISGEFIAGPHARAACQRHLNDLATGHERGLTWHPDEVERVLNYFRRILTVEVEYTDEFGETVSEAVPFEPHESQVFMLGSLFGWRNKNGHRRFRRAYVEIGKGNGKALALDTPVPTPSGWSDMGSLLPGDEVFSADGTVCNVVAVSEVMGDRACYRLRFSDGQTIVADAQHLWRTMPLRTGGKRGPKEPGAARKGDYAVVTTEHIAQTLAVPTGSSAHPQARWNHRVDLAGALELPDLDLPVPPYTLGVWLGDGDSDCGRVTCAAADAPEVLSRIASEGVRVRAQKSGTSGAGRYLLAGVQSTLREIGVLGDKHIPEVYYRASAGQRMELLRGLMDSDGSALKGGAAEYCGVNRRLCEGVAALARTLGFRPNLHTGRATLYGKDCGEKYRVQVYAYREMPIFHLSRKVGRLKPRPKTHPISEGRRIVACDLVDSVPVRCIQVDRPDGMFLVGENYVPTHNSPLAAGIGHYMMTSTGKLRAEIYSAATDKDQAAILFRDAVEMWRRSPALFDRLHPSGQNPVWQLTYLAKASFFKPISSEKKGKSGIRPYCALIDEVHEHPDNSVIEMLRAGTKGNQQALIFEITNSGSDRTSVCWSEHEYSIAVARGDLENDSWFSYVCALDEKDDPFADESCWVKANPLLGVSIHPEFIREQVAEAKGMPGKESLVRRLHFCQWTDGEDNWISRDVWQSVEADLKLEDYRGMECYGGLDLSFTMDLSALSLAFPMEKTVDVFTWFWKPKEGLSAAIKTDRVPYDLYHKNGHLDLTPGKVIKLTPIAAKLAELRNDFDLRAVAYDRYRHRELRDSMEDLGVSIPMVEHPQGFRRAGENPLWMPESVQTLENSIIESTIRVQKNPLLRYNVSQAVVRMDPGGTDNKIFDKKKSRARIDGIVAVAMANGALHKKEELLFDLPLDDLFVEYN